MRNLSYDALNRQIGQTWIVAGTTVNTPTLTYDAANNALTAADGNGAYTMADDALNRLTSQQQVFGQATFTYDAASNAVARQDSQNGTQTSVYDSLQQ